MSKKRKWIWSKELLEDKAVTVKEYDSDGVLMNDDYGDYDWNSKYKERKKFDWGEYNSTGYWKGYTVYKPSTLTYTYVQQMANAIAAQNKVNIQVGKEWNVDLQTKTLTYSPMSLMFGTKGELLATLLHEVGKIRLCSPYNQLSSKWLTEYQQQAYEVVAIFDDFRVDDTMIKSYPSAGEVYESQEPIISNEVKRYIDKSKVFNLAMRETLVNGYGSIKHRMIQQNESFEAAFAKVFGGKSGVKDINELEAFIRNETSPVKPNLYDYLAVVIAHGYGIQNSFLRQDMIQRFELTKQAVGEVVLKGSTQEVVEVLDNQVFPQIEDLLKQTKKGSDSMQDALGKEAAGNVMKHIQTRTGLGQPNSGYSLQKRGGNGRSENNVPVEWQKGDYQVLKDSVNGDIKSLYSKLLNLRKKENIIRYESNQKRGRLNTKKLYQYATGSNRLFKKKHETTDTIRSFVFSILVDVSGSMDGSKIINTTRGLIMLSEVFTKLNMPFEIIHFDDKPRFTKKFDKDYDKEVRNKVADYSTGGGGGTQLAEALKGSGIQGRTELNRVLVVLTDGDTEDPVELDDRYFKPMMKKGIKPIVVGVECDQEMIERHAVNTGKYVDMPSKIPDVFYTMLKSLIIPTNKTK